MIRKLRKRIRRMRFALAFAALVTALVGVIVWAFWEDAFPEWRGYQQDLVRRQVARLETELVSARAALERPEVRYQLERIERALAAAERDPRAPRARLEAIQARLDARQADATRIRQALRRASARLEEPGPAERRRALRERLDLVRQAYASATGDWPPDTSQMSRLWALRDSFARELLAIERPAQALRDSLDAIESDARRLRVESGRLASPRDSLEAIRARLLEPVTLREGALARLRSHRMRIREITSPDGSEVARCPTCHGTIDDPPGVHPPLPSMESLAEVPCTVCHRGKGRSLRLKDAHQGLLAAGGFGAGRRSLRGLIADLTSADAELRARAREELVQLTGADPPGVPDGTANPDSAAAAAWEAWWRTAEPYFEPGAEDADDVGEGRLLAVGVDPWMFSVRGRPLRYVGSAKCLGCHETKQREHVRYEMQRKARSMERLVGEPNPGPCLACHATGYDPATGTYAEPGVTCEACHGPGERYNEMMAVGQELIGKGEQERGTLLLNQAARLARDAASGRMLVGYAGPVNLCVSCHHPRRHQDRGPGVLERQGTTAAEIGAPDSMPARR